jgi:pimeloyl-ACP methyl ester carboxylesterase
MNSTIVSGPEGNLTVYQDGSGPAHPVLFLHADAGRASQWGAVMGGIARKRQTVAFDFRGHGSSEAAPDGDYSYAGRASDITAVVDAIGMKTFVIVAHSGAAGVALEYARHNPGRVDGLFLTDPATDPRRMPLEMRDGYVQALRGADSLEALQGYYASIAGADPVVREQVLADAAVVDPAARLGVGVALAAWNPEPGLDAWRGPIMIVSTEANDTPAALYHLRKGTPHKVISGAGHWVQLEQPRWVVEAIETFLAAVDAAAVVRQ